MAASTPADGQEQRISALEGQLAAAIETFGGELAGLRERVERCERPPGRRAEPAVARGEQTPREAAPPRGAAPPLEPELAAAPAPRAAGVRRAGFGDLIGGGFLAWAGGVAMLLGIVLFLALAIAHGWLGEQARVLLAGAGSLALLAVGSWLHARRGRTDAAVAMAGAAVAGLFATLIVASSVYHLLAGLLALAGALAVGVSATVLAIRWAGRPLAGIGLIGALAAPALVGAPAQWPTLAMLLAAAACAMWTAARQRWAWLSLAAVAVCAPQWAVPMLAGQTPGEDLAVLVAFAALGLAGALACTRTTDCAGGAGRCAPAALAALSLNAVGAALVGRIALGAAGSPLLGEGWLAVLAGAHLALGLAPHRLALDARLRAVSIALGVALADALLALSLDGPVLVFSWGASAVALAAATRRLELDQRSAALRDIGVGVQVSLALTRALLEAPPRTLLGGGAGVSGAFALAALSASCLASAHLLNGRRSAVRTTLNTAGLATIAYLTAVTLSGPALVAAWSAEGAALLGLGRRVPDELARAAGALFAAGATLYTLTAVAPPSGLAGGSVQLGAAALAVCALALLAWRTGRLHEAQSRSRRLATIASGGALLYLASLAVATLPQGQLALSVLWALAGVAALTAGLKIDAAPLRNAALVLLLATTAKVFVYDLSTLTSITRALSFLVLGTLLLAGAFAYQRLRPPASTESVLSAARAASRSEDPRPRADPPLRGSGTAPA
jgi:uncharacterized membrane protein